MTDSTTADVLAMRRLILEHKLSLWWHHTAWATEDGYGLSQHRGYGPTDVAAVRAWAEAAGVPWPSVDVVPMWAVVDSGAVETVKGHKDIALGSAYRHGGTVVPCEVVIRTETEATP